MVLHKWLICYLFIGQSAFLYCLSGYIILGESFLACCTCQNFLYTQVSAPVWVENRPLIAFLPALALLTKTWMLHRLENHINGVVAQIS